MLLGWVVALAAAASTSPAILLDEHIPPGLDRARMQVVTIPPSNMETPTTRGSTGHSHPGATYVYVVSGKVLSALGEGPELPFSAGQSWSEAPGQAHYIVNASRTEPARLLVVFLVPSTATAFTQPLPQGRAPKP